MLGWKESELSFQKKKKKIVVFFLQLFRLESICGDSNISLVSDALVVQYVNLVVALGQNGSTELIQ